MEVLEALDTWQAYSHPELSECKPEELFSTGFAAQYRFLHKDIWERIVRLNGTILSLETLREFPFHLVYAPGNMEFWRLVFSNFYEVTCLNLHGLSGDAGNDVHSIPSFKKTIVSAQWIDPRAKELLLETLKERRFDSDVRAVAGRVTALRNNRIAHRLIDKENGGFKGDKVGVTLKELRALFNAVHAQFGAVSFGSAYVTLAGDMMPGRVQGKPARSCLDGVLDSVLRGSGIVNQPERHGQWWSDLRKCRSPEELRVMNELRQRVGLPEA